MEIVSALPADALAIAQIHVAAWQAAYRDIVPAEFLASLSTEKRHKYWLGAIAAGSPQVLVAKSAREVIGWVAFGPCRDAGASPKEAEVWAIYVAPQHWSQGVGAQLWQNARVYLVKQGYTTVSLWVLVENLRAVRFYQATGFMKEQRSIKEVTIGGKALQEVRYVGAADG